MELENKEIPICDNCGSQMEINLSNAKRVWVCPNALNFLNYEKYKDCSSLGIEVEDKPLKIKTITRLMAQEAFVNSDSKGKEQANYRRVAGGIRKARGNRYVSESEDQILLEAVEILERLATAAENVKKEKKRLEMEAEALRSRREKEAGEMIADTEYFHTDRDAIKLFTAYVALKKVNSNDFSRATDFVTKANTLTKLINELRYEYQSEIRILVSDVGYHTEQTVSEIIEKAHLRCLEIEKNGLGKYAKEFEHINYLITLDNADNVVTLDSKKN